MDISIVIPLLNEEESIPELAQWIEKVMTDNNFSYEIVFVDDGSSDSSWEIIQKLSKENNYIKGIKFKTKLWEISSLEYWFWCCKRRCCYNHGC